MKFKDVISGSICYFRSFSISDISANNHDTISTIKESFKKEYTHLCYSEKENEVLKNIKTAQEFLHPSGLPFLPERIIIEDLKFSHDTLPIKDSCIMFTVFPEIGVVSLAINLTFEKATTDEVIFLKQCAGGEQFNVENNNTTNKLTINNVFDNLIKAGNIPTDAFTSNCLLEINEFGANDDLESILANETNRIYGLLTGDEGWQFASQDLAKERLSQNWGSRKFVKFIVFDTNFLLFNLNKNKTELDYEKHQNEYTSKYHGSLNNYFSMKSTFAGINHGILFSIETVIAMKTVTKNILNKQTYFRTKKVENFNAAIKRTKSYRQDLMLTLNKLQEMDISELGELESLVLKSQQIDPVIEKIKYLLELLESDLSLMYSQQTNKLVNLLTIFGLLFTIIQTITSIIALF